MSKYSSETVVRLYNDLNGTPAEMHLTKIDTISLARRYQLAVLRQRTPCLTGVLDIRDLEALEAVIAEALPSKAVVVPAPPAAMVAPKVIPEATIKTLEKLVEWVTRLAAAGINTPFTPADLADIKKTFCS